MNVLRVGASSGTDAKSSVYPAFSVSGNSDEFDDNSFSGWTAVQTTPALTLTETNNALSIYHPGGDSAGVFHAWVKAQSFVANDWVEIAVRGLGTNQNYNIIGLVFADGNTYNAGNQVAGYFSPTEQTFWISPRTGYNASGGVATNVGVAVTNMAYGDLIIRFRYNGSNSWRIYLSPDGVSYVPIGASATTYSLTPTHAGFFVTSWGGASPFAWSVRYCRFGNG